MAGFIILGVKKNEHFSIDFNRKSEELSFNSKDNSLTFYATKEGTFFKICHFLITGGRVVLHNKFYKKNFIYQLSKMKRLFRQKNFFLVAGFIILRVKKNEHFSIDFNRKSEELSFNSKDNSLTVFFMRQKEGNVFFKICHFLITGHVHLLVLHKKFYKKISSTSYQKWKDYLGKKTSFWWLDLLFSG